jgi:molecular chaperone DnaK (HSP70)
MEKIFGIDLGTTNSEIAYFKNGKPGVIPIENGVKYLPSVVGIDVSGNMVTGFKARNQYAAYPENTVMSVKRLMGSGKTVTMAGKEYTPAQISAEILKTLKQAAERETGLSVEKAVITVPAYFTDLQRKETIQAGELAGLEVVRIINEPTAAALAYGCRENQDQRERILVYDLGGGTFDISLIDVEEGITEVLASDGNSRLGGDDFDLALEEHLRSYLPAAIRQQSDLKLDARLKRLAEEVKIKLSRESRVEVKEEFIVVIDGKPVHLELSVSREDFENRIADRLDETADLLENVLNQGGVKKEKIDRVLLVGGSTYIPAIFDMLGTGLGFDIHREVDPIYCVALGAAVQGAIISGEEVEAILVDVSSHSLGIRCLDGGLLGVVNDDYYSIVIHRNTPIPAAMTNNYYTVVPNQKSVEITAYQGENPAASKNTLLGSFILEDLPPNLPASSEIAVTFEYNLDGIVEISALERRSERKQQLKVDVHRLDVKEEEGPPEAGEETAAGEGMSRRQVERILKKAGKVQKKIDDAEILAELDKRMANLEETLEKNDKNTDKLAGELAEFMAEL